jgi:hypothetical protein
LLDKIGTPGKTQYKVEGGKVYETEASIQS